MHQAGSQRGSLREQPWAGNVRELENCIRRALVVEGGDIVLREHLGFDELSTGGTGVPRGDEAERADLERLLLRHTGSVSHAAEELGLSRQALYRKMEKHGITLERRPKD